MRLPPSPSLLPLLLVAAAFLPAPPAGAGNDPSGVVLLVNDEHPDSAAVAAHYATRRDLPPRQVLHLRVSVKPELTLQEFRASIEEPLRDHLLREGLEERARCLVLSRGFPVRVRSGPGFVSTTALLQVLDLPLSGMPQAGVPGTPLDSLLPADRANPYREGPFPEDRRPGGRALRLVTMLDGWTAADAMALVDRSVEADGGPPADPLFVFQDANGNAGGRNPQYAAAAESLKGAGFRVDLVAAGKEKVKGAKDLMGWMSGGAYSNLDGPGVLSNAFAPGAIADMLESFGAVPENFREKGPHFQFPVPWMIRAGAAGVHGAVAEPYAHTFPDVRIFERYTSGLDLAESFHGSLPYLHWMNLVLGDPLCAPFARRPRVAMTGLPDRVREAGPVTVRVTAAAAPGGDPPVSLALFVDGEPAGTAEGREAEFLLDLGAGPDGPRTVLAVARTGGATLTRGWKARTVEVSVAAPRVVSRLPAADAFAVPPSTVPAVAWAGSGAAPGIGLLDADGKEVAGKAAVDGTARRASFVPAAPLAPGASYSVRIEGIGGDPGSSFTVGAAALEASVPTEVVAGEEAVLRVSAAGAAGGSRALSGERLEAWLSDPPVRAAFLDVARDAAGPVEIRLRPLKAGTVAVTLRGRRSGAAGSATLTVRPGPAAALFLRMGPKTPLGEPFDIAVQVRDAFGNAVPDWTGTVTLSSNDPAAVLPAPVAVGPGAGGRAQFRGVAFGTAGVHVLAASADGGLQGADDTLVEAPDPAVTRWLLWGPHGTGPKDPFDGALLPGKDGERRPAPGAVLGDAPRRAGTAENGPGDPGKGKGVLLAAAYLSFREAGEADLVLAHGGRVKAWFEGREVYAGGTADASAGERGKVRLKVPKGPATLMLRVEVRGGGQDSFGALLLGTDGKPLPGMKVLEARPVPADALSISGVVKDGKGPVAGAEVRLTGKGSGKTKTDAGGWYGFGGLKAGNYRVAVKVPGRKVEPEVRSVEIKEAEAGGVDFGVK